MPYGERWPRSRCLCSQTINAEAPVGDLTPASQAPAVATTAGWAPLLTGQLIPMVGERVVDDDDICTCT